MRLSMRSACAIAALLSVLSASTTASPSSFVLNAGQLPDGVHAVRIGSGLPLWLTGRSLVIPSSEGRQLTLEFGDHDLTPRVEGTGEITGRANFFLGSSRDQWRSDVPLYGEVAARDVMDGVDLLVRGHGEAIEFGPALRPGCRARADAGARIGGVLDQAGR